MYELLKPFLVQGVDFKWSSGSKVNKRRWFLPEQADVLVKLENHRALHSPVLLTNELQKTNPVNTAKKTPKNIQLSPSLSYRCLDSERCAEGGSCSHSVSLLLHNPPVATAGDKSLL